MFADVVYIEKDKIKIQQMKRPLNWEKQQNVKKKKKVDMSLKGRVF